MIRKPGAQETNTPQLGLPFVQQGPAHDLSYYLGICSVFAGHHKRWPSAGSSREEFRAARIFGYDGRRLEREVRFPGPELEADPAYRALLERCRAEGIDAGPGLAMLDPRYRSVLDPDAIADLLDSLSLAGNAAPGDVRYATGIAAHAPGELSLQCGDAIRARALEQAGLDALDPQVLRLSSSVRVRANDALKGFIGRSGMLGRADEGPLADHFRLEAGDDGRLRLRYRLREGGRYVGRFDAEGLTARLAGALAAAPVARRPH